jgi:hypothetical protein
MINTILLFFRTNPLMKGAFQMLDGDKQFYSWRNHFIVHFADQMLEFVCVSLFLYASFVIYISMIEIMCVRVLDLGSITFKYNRLHYNYFAIFMITLHYDYIHFQMYSIKLQLLCKCNRLYYWLHLMSWQPI